MYAVDMSLPLKKKKGGEAMKYDKYKITKTDRSRLGHLLLSHTARIVAEPGVLETLECQLDGSNAMLSESIPGDVVTMNSTVRLVSETSGAQIIRTVVYPEDVEFIDNGVSVLDILGSNLIGRKVGDLLKWETWEGCGPWRIAKIVFQPERVGELRL